MREAVSDYGRAKDPAQLASRVLGGPSLAILVEFCVGELVQLSLDEIKAIIIDLVCRNHWYRQGGESETEFRTAFEGMRSIEEVMQNISFYGKWQG